MISEWGPWVEHDGTGCPLAVGTVVEAEGVMFGRKFFRVMTVTAEVLAMPEPGCFNPWIWKTIPRHLSDCNLRVIRFRVRRPRGMVVLESVLADLPEGVDA